MKNVINSIKKYPLIRQKAYSKSNKSNVIKIDWNESPYPPHPSVINAMVNYLQSSNSRINWYPDLSAQDLIYEISKYLSCSNNNISIFPGSDAALELIGKMFINKDDKIVVVAPTYDQFRIDILLNGGIVKNIFFKNIFKKDIDHIVKELKKINDCSLVYLCNPNNPTGIIFTTEEVEYLLNEFKDIFFIIDEAYIEFSNQQSCSILLKKKSLKNFVITRTFSKAFALAGLRLGYTVSPISINEQIKKVKNHKSVGILSQIAGVETLRNIKYYEKKIEKIKSSREYMIKTLKLLGISIVGGDGNFLLIKTHNSSNMISILEENNIYARNLSHLEELDGYFRISIGTKNDMNVLLDKLKQIYERQTNNLLRY